MKLIRLYVYMRLSLHWIIKTAIVYFFFLTTLSDAAENDYVSKVFPYSLEFMLHKINLQFDSNERAFYEDYNGAIYQLPLDARTIKDLDEQDIHKFMAFPMVRPSKFYVFYGAYKNMQHFIDDITPSTVAGLDNPALIRYASLPKEARANDIYLWSPDAPYWYSEEHVKNGRSLPFHSYFILHLAKTGENTTEVEIIEDKPTVSMGRKRDVDANGTVTRFDIRPTYPSIRDRQYLLSCISQFIERRVPGRHWFSCRSE